MYEKANRLLAGMGVGHEHGQLNFTAIAGFSYICSLAEQGSPTYHDLQESGGRNAVRRVNDWLRGSAWAHLVRLILIAMVSCATAFAQSQTHTVTVNADGTFTPQVSYIRSGDTVRWEQLTSVVRHN